MLKGQTAFITGTNRGLGKAFVESFAENGADVIAHARKDNPDFRAFCMDVASRNGVRITPVFFDVTDAAAMKDAVHGFVVAQTTIDILVNNAGVTDNALFQMSSEKMLRSEFEINVFAPFRLTQYVLKLMLRKKRGSIVNVASVSGMRGDVGRSVYGMTKAALISMTQSLAAEVGRQGVRVNAIAPGFIDTDMMSYMTRAAIERNLEMSRLGRIGTPKEVADLAVFLASDRSSYMTGQVIRVDGGMGS